MKDPEKTKKVGVLNYLTIMRTPELSFVRVKDDDWKLFSKAAKPNQANTIRVDTRNLEGPSSRIKTSN